MYINFTIEAGGGRTDVSADERRRIADVFLLLRENGKVNCDSVPAYFHSALLAKLVSANETIAGAGIVDGDLLKALESKLESEKNEVEDKKHEMAPIP